MSAAGAATVGKKGLCVAINWTRPTLDRRLKSDPSFPVVGRGDQSGGWEFDVAAVRQYLDGPAKPAGKKPALVIDKAQLKDAVKPPPLTGAVTVTVPARKTAHHQGEATARQRKDNAEASLKENKLRLENAELVWRADIRQAAANVMASLGNSFDGIPDLIAKKLQLPDAVQDIQEIIDKVRIEMVDQTRKLLDE